MKAFNSQTPNPKIQNPDFSKLLLIGVDSFTGKWFFDLYKDDFDIYGTYLENSKKEIENSFYSSPKSKSQNPNPRFYPCDITNKEQIKSTLEKVGPDYIINFAGISYAAEENPLIYYKVNTIAVENILSSVIESDIKLKKLILPSSAVVYGKNANPKTSEDECPEPINHYGISKLAMEKIASIVSDNLNIIITRPFNYTGPGQDDRFIIPKIIKHFKENKKEIELGDIDSKREFNDIRFVCYVYKKLLLSDCSNAILNICTGKAYSIREIIKIIGKITNNNILIKKNKRFFRKNEIPLLSGDPSCLNSIVDNPINYDIIDTIKLFFNSEED
ncbi:MAG: epimerase [Candidatus Muiribacterium halophilum]|uniref:Epimerase n=1 Tax=Muiribacterium halophilum TaxID=2053465 RepID=A0A2N5Z9U0_MUIH1|nr:MAG: epimerase [Candidatus Muirbacterium halophilum]